ncbi:Sensor protein ZraS [Thalassoglobus neptunius]|uniref:histidine kinase n=1 Tax=Thalassoglobus neptunius TaxID=1938619 RepID=A0A5C5WBM5_9PLAN|nr:ATP-binding protein [Thalassoglobus neptunius]TWT47887.1 Sensor protein ZraS [Thalassoglobus neptunius]
MTEKNLEPARNSYRLVIIGLMVLSAASLAVTIWIMVDFLREQKIVDELIRRLPSDATASAVELAGELKWQFRLAILVLLNLIVTGIAVVLLWRAYRSSLDSLRDFKALAGDILNSMDQAVITTDLAGRVTRINRRGIDLLSSGADCIGRSLEELSKSVPLESFRKEWMSSRSPSETRDLTVQFQGDDRTLRASCLTLCDIENNEIGNVLQVHDVTERILIEEKMLRMERYMGLGAVAVGLHHEIRNPLAALSLHVQLLEEELEQVGSGTEVVRMLEVIQTEISRVSGVLEGFRDFASIGRLELEMLDLGEIIERIVKLLSPRATQQNVSISFLSSETPLPKVAADQMRLEQVLLNLLINGMEAMSDGGKLTVVAEVENDLAMIRVTDSGRGIPKDLHDRIFDPYFSTKSDGTGLGLALCDKIMRQHQGKLEFQTSNRGTTFQLSWPATKIEEVMA